MTAANKKLTATLKELTGNDEEFFNELVSAYIENMEEFKVKASRSVQELDAESLKEHLHKINPTLLTLTYDKEYKELASMQDQLYRDAIEDNLEKINLIMDKAINQLKEVKIH